jgi:hypothetical protein
MTQQACAAVTQRGTPCKGIVPAGRMYCLVHDPELKDKVTAARRRGGSTAMKLKLLEGKRLKLDTPAALVRFNAGLIQDTLAATVDPGVSRAVSYAIANQLRLLETADLETRLAALEAAAGHGHPRRFQR